MRRRRVEYVREHSERPAVLLMAAGAIAGAAAGLYLGRKYRTVGAFLDDMREKLDEVRGAWQEEAALDDLAEPDGARLRRGSEGADEAVDDDWVDGDKPFMDGSPDVAEDELDDLTDEDVIADGAVYASANGKRSAADSASILEARVLAALQSDRRLRARAVELAVVGDGVVELTGTVHTLDEISLAAQLVRRVPGVAMVLNRVEVRTQPPPADARASAPTAPTTSDSSPS